MPAGDQSTYTGGFSGSDQWSSMPAGDQSTYTGGFSGSEEWSAAAADQPWFSFSNGFQPTALSSLTSVDQPHFCQPVSDLHNLQSLPNILATNGYDILSAQAEPECSSLQSQVIGYNAGYQAPAVSTGDMDWRRETSASAFQWSEPLEAAAAHQMVAPIPAFVSSATYDDGLFLVADGIYV